ncbi:M23 family metallopeptidase [Coleofasciculus sp. G2-EDA-02]|uniref:M23 family metallopeptidase n=1 Tax=Coleofasciculus sp. G2-EDA-02 TaxID=3069529 RepID=UPI0032FBCE60
MNKKTVANSTPTGVFYRYPWLKQGISWMGGLGVLSSGLVVAQTDAPIDTGIAPAAPPAPPAIKFTPPPPAPPAQPKPVAPAVVVAPPAPAPKPAYQPPAPPAPKPPAPAPVSVSKPPAPAPAPAAPTPTVATPPAAKPRLDAPNLSIPAPATLAKPPKVIINPSSTQEAAQTPATPNNSYIDRTNYSLGATQSPAKPAVILTERSTGCQTVSRNGQLVSGSCGGQAAPRQQTQTVQAGVQRGVQRGVQTGVQAGRIQRQPHQLQGGTGTQITRLPAPPVTLGASVSQPVRSVQRVTASVNPRIRQFTRPPGVSSMPTTASPKTTPTGLTYYNFSNRPLGRPLVGNASFIFPLTIPAAISSVFGWRMHPIAGTYRFHSGTDIAAPTGTPVLAVAPGEVATADFLGGYGLTVILRHEEGTQESRYAHLSEIFVQPGESVDQGSVIGLVGSTGFSTGPHLHFEWRHQTTDGWVAVDAGAHLEYAMAQLIEALKVAQALQQPDS